MSRIVTVIFTYCRHKPTVLDKYCSHGLTSIFQLVKEDEAAWDN
jgi:hypothetical protein